jgi:vacuolar-type H+-ATPase subunit H
MKKTNVREYKRGDGTKVTSHKREITTSSNLKNNASNYTPPNKSEVNAKVNLAQAEIIGKEDAQASKIKSAVRSDALRNLMSGSLASERSAYIKAYNKGYEENASAKTDKNGMISYKGWYLQSDARDRGWYYIKKTPTEKRNYGVEYSIERAKERVDELVKDAKMRKEGNLVKKGDVFYTSWGYDQTNYDYLVVVKPSPTGKTAICKMAKFETVGHTQQTNIQKPTRKGYGKEFRMQVKVSGGRVSLNGSYPFIQNDDGSRASTRMGYFSKWDGEESFHETDSMFGH